LENNRLSGTVCHVRHLSDTGSLSSQNSFLELFKKSTRHVSMFSYVCYKCKQYYKGLVQNCCNYLVLYYNKLQVSHQALEIEVLCCLYCHSYSHTMFCHLQFSALLIIIFIMELAAGIAGYVYKSKVSIWSLLFTLLKSPEHSLCIKIGGGGSRVFPSEKTTYNCVIKHKLKVPCASFVSHVSPQCTGIDYASNTLHVWSCLQFSLPSNTL